MWLRRLATALVAPAMVVPIAGVRPAVADLRSGAPALADRPASVTLITGDRVVLGTGGAMSVRPAPDRAGARFVGWTSAGHRYVVPADAVAMVRDGRLDQRLFDVTLLREFGYTGEAAMPVLVAYPRSGNRKGPASARAATIGTARLDRDLTAVGVLTARVERGARSSFWSSATMGTGTGRTLRPGIERIYLDGKRKPQLDVSVPQIGAPAAWQAGFDGSGVTVAVLDTGIDATHPDFAGRLAATENFTTDPSADDLVGHGTHVASIIAGGGARSGGRYRGVAPGARLAVGKVCTTDDCPDSAILAGMQWAARNAQVVNMSLAGWDNLGVDPLEQAVNDLTAAYGALFVIAAGNYGGTGTIGRFGSADAALTVGAVDDRDQLAPFSSRGPRPGDDAIKPDLTAPGVGIVAAGAAKGTSGTPAGDGYVSLDGTSMAAPHVAGAAAILTQQRPGWSAQRRKALLMGTATPTPGVDVFEQGAGRVDVARAVRQAVWADEGSISFGRQQWPHDDDVPVTRTVTYRNESPAAITLHLGLDAVGTFALAASSVTVPAGGAATTTVTADTGGVGTDGFKTGRIVATGPGGARVETPIAVNREVESYDVTMRYLGRDGRPSADYFTALDPLDGTAGPLRIDSPSVIRLPKGEYRLAGWIFGASDQTMFVQPGLVVDGPETITLDARRGRAVDITVPSAGARLRQVGINAEWRMDATYLAAFSSSERPGDTFTAQVGPRAKLAGFAASISASFDGPRSYDVAYRRDGTFFTGLSKTVDADALARIRATYARNATGVAGIKSNMPGWSDGSSGVTTGHELTVPADRIEYVNTDGGVRWQGLFEEIDAGRQQLSTAIGPVERLTAGEVRRQEWNSAVFGPAVDQGMVARFDDLMMPWVPLFARGGQFGSSRTDTVRTALYAGDRLIGEAASEYAEFTVPTERTDYRLEMSATRSAPFRLSTSVSGVWTFSSAGGDTELPLSGVRFDPRLTADNTAPPGPFAIRAVLEQATTLTAEYSVDDGRTWRPAVVRGTGEERVLRVDNPAEGFVSLRATLAGTSGNTAVITVLRAYAIS